MSKADQDQDFLDAAQQKDRGLIGEFVGFMAENKAWWMAPILIVLGLLGVLLLAGASGIGPFVYVFG
ncbi:MAG: hypothetical protein IPK26_18970 [Planctomycetes bacterium]|nr:hypothetical protein [Planctomycetota bacterium]